MPLSSVVGAQSIVKPGVCTSSTRPASPYDGQVIYETDTDTMLVYESSTWNLVRPQIAIFNETQTSATAGGGFTSGSYVKRTLNTTVTNNISGCSISSSVITLGVGTYFVTASAPAYAVDSHKIRLQNTSDSTTIVIGSSEAANNTYAGYNRSLLSTTFSLTASKTIELQHRCATTKTTNGLGIASSFGDSEIYAEIRILRIA